MPSIKSDLTNKTFASTGGLREFEVPDDSGYHQEQQTVEPQGIDFDEIDSVRAARGLPALDEPTKHAMLASLAEQQGGMPPRRPVSAPPLASQSSVTPTRVLRQQSIQDLAEFERKVADAKKERATGRQKLSRAAKDRIEALCGMSRGLKEVDIDGQKYLLKTLKGIEQREALVAIMQFDGNIELPYESRKQVLARALIQVAGADIELFLGDSSMEAKLEFIDLLEDPVLTKLYSVYLELVTETQSKYAVKNEKDAQEVADSLKK
jgi:hypothetical protein